MIESTSSSAASAATSTASAAPSQMRQAAEQFEAIFLRQILGSMRQAKLADDIFGSRATDQFRDMADARTAQSMAETGSFGIAELLTAQFGRQAASQTQNAVRIGNTIATDATDATGAANAAASAAAGTPATNGISGS